MYAMYINGYSETFNDCGNKQMSAVESYKTKSNWESVLTNNI